MARNADALPDDDAEAIAELTGQPHGYERLERTTVDTYRGVPRRCPPAMRRNREATERFMDKVDAWADHPTAQAVDELKLKLAQTMLERFQRGEIKSLDDLSEDVLVAQLGAIAVDPRRPQLAVAAIREILRAQEARRDQGNKGTLDEKVAKYLAERAEREEELKASHRRVRHGRGSRAQHGDAPDESAGDGAPQLRRVE